MRKTSVCGRISGSEFVIDGFQARAATSAAPQKASALLSRRTVAETRLRTSSRRHVKVSVLVRLQIAYKFRDGAAHAYHLAQINIARLVAPLDDPRIAEFVALLDPSTRSLMKLRVLSAAQSESGSATDIAYTTTRSSSSNVVWSPSSRCATYAYKSDHAKVFPRPAKWFEKAGEASYCLWWVPLGHIPTVAEVASGWSTIRRTARRRILSRF